MGKTRVVHVNDDIEGAVYIGRTNQWRGLKRSPLANPFMIGPACSRGEAIANYARGLDSVLAAGNRRVITALVACRGKPLACWCRHDGEERTDANACHGDVLVELLERYSDDELRAMSR
jgi:hypothetical protein